MVAPTGSITENTYTMIGASISIGGSCTMASMSTSNVHSPAAGTPATISPMAARIDCMMATPSTPSATLRTVFSEIDSMRSPLSPASRLMTARVPATLG